MLGTEQITQSDFQNGGGGGLLERRGEHDRTSGNYFHFPWLVRVSSH